MDKLIVKSEIRDSYWGKSFDKSFVILSLFGCVKKKTFENFILSQAVSSLVGVSQTSRNTVIRGNVSRIIDSIVFRFSLLPCFKVRFDGFLSQVGCRAVYGKLRRAARVGGGGGEQDADGRQLGRAQACQAPLGRARPAFEDGGLAQAASIWQPAQRSVGDCRRAQMREGPDELKVLNKNYRSFK